MFSYRALFLKSAFLTVYFKEYSRKGDFFVVRFDFSNIEKEVIEKPKRWFVEKVLGGEYVEPDDCSKAGDAINIEACEVGKEYFGELTSKSVDEIKGMLLSLEFGDDSKVTAFGKLADGGFVSRSGSEYSIPGYIANSDPLAENQIDSSDVDFLAIGNNLAHVFAEGVGDSMFGVPGVPRSTGCSNGLIDCYEPDDSGKAIIDEVKFVLVNERADKGEAIARAATGRLIRGISSLSLGTDALASMIESFVAGASRKGIEKTLWCLEACAG